MVLFFPQILCLLNILFLWHGTVMILPWNPEPGKCYSRKRQPKCFSLAYMPHSSSNSNTEKCASDRERSCHLLLHSGMSIGEDNILWVLTSWKKDLRIFSMQNNDEYSRGKMCWPWFEYYTICNLLIDHMYNCLKWFLKYLFIFVFMWCVWMFCLHSYRCTTDS